MDFFDYHEYNDSGSLDSYDSLGIDKPCIIGECGQGTKTWDDSIQKNANEAFMRNAWNNGYAGVLLWQYNYPGASEILTLVNSDASWRPVCYSIQDFSIQHCEDINMGAPCEPIEEIEDKYKVYFGNNPAKLEEGVKIYFASNEDKPFFMTIYNLRGEKIKTLISDKVFLKYIRHEIIWYCDDDNNKKVLPGIYLLHIKFGDEPPQKKLIGVVE